MNKELLVFVRTLVVSRVFLVINFASFIFLYFDYYKNGESTIQVNSEFQGKHT